MNSRRLAIRVAFLASVLLLVLILSACQPQSATFSVLPYYLTALASTPDATVTPETARPNYAPGELVDYVVQSGDTLPALAIHFNTTEQEIRDANPVIPEQVTTLPPGLPLKIPIYYRALWGSSYQIIPDNAFVNGPAQVDFDVIDFVNNMPGWLKSVREYAGNQWRTGGEFIQYIANNFSISPRLLLAILEYQLHALTQPNAGQLGDYPLGYQDSAHVGLYLQLVWAANVLNNGYYGWREGRLTTFNIQDGTLENPDPWQNAASVALHYYFSQTMGGSVYASAVSGQGLAKTYSDLFGDPWADSQPVMEGSLEQPALNLPFSPGQTWTFTGGPHTGWGTGDPFAALDFAPPLLVSGCVETDEYATAVADGVIARSEYGVVLLDLDGDGDERTGWVIFYMHVATRDRITAGSRVQTGDRIGHPSCEGGTSTGTHIHIARKYNGEWVAADGPLAFNLEGWVASNGNQAYAGKLTKHGNVITACSCSNAGSRVTSTGNSQ